MEVNCFRLSDTRLLEPVTQDIFAGREAHGASEYWMDIRTTDHEAVAEIAEALAKS